MWGRTNIFTYRDNMQETKNVYIITETQDRLMYSGNC